MRRSILALLLTLVGCGAASPSPAPTSSAPSDENDPALQAPEFAWSAPIAVTVVENVHKQKQTAKLAYRLDVCPSPDGTFDVSHHDFHFVSLNGIPANDPRVAEGLARLAPLSAAIPILVVGKNGRYRDIRGIDQMLAQLEKVVNKEQIETLRTFLKNPAQARLLTDAAAFRWKAWVESWLNYDPKLGKKQSVTGIVPGIPADKTPHGEMTFEGPVSNGHVRLSQVTHLDGPEARHAMAALAAALEGSDVDLERMIVSVDQSSEIETEWPKLRPARVVTKKAVNVELDGAKREFAETHEYLFDWDANGKEPECP